MVAEKDIKSIDFYKEQCIWSGHHNSNSPIRYSFGVYHATGIKKIVGGEGCFGFLQNALMVYNNKGVRYYDEYYNQMYGWDIKYLYLNIFKNTGSIGARSTIEILNHYKELFENYAQRNNLELAVTISPNNSLFIQFDVKWLKHFSVINGLMNLGRSFAWTRESGMVDKIEFVKKFLQVPFEELQNIESFTKFEQDIVDDRNYMDGGIFGTGYKNVNAQEFDLAIKKFEVNLEINKMNESREMIELLEKLKKSKKYLKIRSRHPTHDFLRGKIKTLVPIVYRLGSQSETEGFTINHPDSILVSSNKLAMKKAFTEANVKQALWCRPTTKQEVLDFWNKNIEPQKNKKVIVKSLYSSRGNGLYVFDTLEALSTWFEGTVKGGAPRYERYILEKFYTYSKEYRIHVTAEGAFYACRKMLKADTPEGDRWHRHDTNCVWILEENPQFEKPGNWNKIVEECVKALNATGLTIGACDVILQKTTDNPEFIICETNSAPSFGEVTGKKYLEVLQKMVLNININNLK